MSSHLEPKDFEVHGNRKHYCSRALAAVRTQGRNHALSSGLADNLMGLPEVPVRVS